MASALLILAASLPWGTAKVTAVEVDAPGIKDRGRIESVFAIRPGDQLSREAIRAGVQALIATREVEDVWVEVVPHQEGLTLQVHAQVASRVASIRFLGLSSRQRALLSRELRLRVGMPLSVPRFEQALVRAQALLRADGFPEAELEPVLDFHVSSGTVDVTVDAKLGPPQILCELQAKGLPPAWGSLWRTTKAKRGQRLTTGAQEGLRRRLTSALRRAGFWQAKVDGPGIISTSCGARAEFLVQTGPRFVLRLEGDQVRRDTLEEAFPFLSGDDSFAEGSEEWLAGRLKRALQRQGHLLAQVEVRLAGAIDEPALVVRIQRGPRLKVTAVRFPGIPPGSALEAELRQHVVVRGGRFTTLTSLAWDDDTFLADRDSALAMLKTLGYAEAEVELPHLVREGKKTVVEFPVKLGPRWVIEDATVYGWPEELPPPELSLKAGDAWNPLLVQQTRAQLLGQLQEAGFMEAVVTADNRCVQNRCRPLFAVTPGPSVKVGRVVVAALAKTNPKVVRRLVEIREGDPVSPEKLLGAQRQLLELGIFDQVTIRKIPGQESGLEEGLVVEANEAPTRSLAGGIGWDTDEKLRLSGSWTELNLFGEARILSVDGRFSSRQRRFQLNYREPARLGLLGLPTWLAIYRSEESFSSYSLLRRGMWVEVGDRLARPRRFLLRYDYQIIAPEAPEAVLSSLERNRQHLRVASFTPILEWDTRNDLFSPSRGGLVSLQLQRAFPIFLADASFSKLVGNAAWYHPVGGTVLAFSLRTGWVKPYQGDRSIPDNLRLPIAVRFFAGGRVSHRSFPTDRLGVPGQTLLCPQGEPSCPASQLKAIGGAALLLGSAEWRIPVAGSFGVTLFADGGNTWAGVREIRWADVRWGAGLGLRFETPVGPIRLEYGWKLDRLPAESKGELFLSFGNPF